MNTMNKDEEFVEKICPRCGSKLICRHKNIQLCDCRTIELSEKARLEISNNYSDCLCLKCLKYFSKKH
jgi:ribosomal protein S27AE